MNVNATGAMVFGDSSLRMSKMTNDGHSRIADLFVSTHDSTTFRNLDPISPVTILIRPRTRSRFVSCIHRQRN